VTPGGFYSYGGFFKSGGISQPTEHWFGWNSSKTGYDTSTRTGLPWPNYFTPHFKAGTGASDWVYVNRTFQLPAGFPNVELAHSFSANAACNGTIYMDNVFFRPIPAPTATNWTTWVPFGSTWRYFTNTPPTNWFAPNFNDAAWPVGTAKFGAGTGPTNIVTQLPQLKPGYYFRRQFVLGSADAEELLLSATCTDDSGNGFCPIRVFLNGNEVKSPIETVTGQGNEVKYFDLTPFAGMIQAGTNTIAVAVSNYWSTWDDVAFDVSLKAMVYHPVMPKLAVQGIQSGTVKLSVDSPTGSVWQIQSKDGMAGTNWHWMQTFTNAPGGAQNFSDTGQNGRGPPASASCRLYRLVPY